MLSLALISLLAATPPTPKPPKDWVTDEAGLLSTAARARLNRRLEVLEHATGHQLLIWTGRSTNGEPIETFAPNAFEAWKVERGRLDNGAILFVFKDETLRLEVGAGLQRVLTPEQSRRILDERIAPFLKAGEPEVAINSGVDGIATQLTGAPMPATPVRDRLSTQQWVVMGLVLLGALGVMYVARPESLRWFFTLSFLRRRRQDLPSR